MTNYKDVNPLSDFNWEEFENGKTVGGDKNELTKAYDDTLNKIQEHQVVEGVVTAIDKKEVVVNIGYKSDGIIPASEFRYNPDLKVGDKVEVYVENQEDKGGQLILSHKKARLQKSWENINKALEDDAVIQGYIKSRTKGGMIVDVFGIEAFLPGSQIDVHPIRDYDMFVGKTMEFKVVKINQEFRNVVVSHKALIEAELEAQRKEIISHLEKGQILEGVVKNITSYGVFVDLGGVDGLIHITDLSWGRINDPHEIVELDQKINVVILDFDEEKKRIALGLKQLAPHPWDALDPNLKVGDHVKGKVVVMANYGAFVEIQPGVEGLIHVSEMSWSQHLRSAQEFLKAGDEVEAVILTLDRDERKMSLGIKQLREDPWETMHGVAADDHQGGIRLPLGPGDGGGHLLRLGAREGLHLLNGGRLLTGVGGEHSQDGVLIDVGDPHERLDACGAQGGQTTGGLRGQEDHGPTLDDGPAGRARRAQRAGGRGPIGCRDEQHPLLPARHGSSHRFDQ